MWKIHAKVIGVGMALAVASGVWAGNRVAYMTGSVNPYGLSPSDPGSPEHAMQLIYGPDGYDRFQGFDYAIFTADYDAIYIEGSDVASGEFLAAHNAEVATSYRARGGRLYVNAAITDWGSTTALEIANGVLLKPGVSLSATSLYVSDNGAGFAWTGTPFAAGIIDDWNISVHGPGAPIQGDAGPVYGWYWNPSSSGYLFVGTMAAPALHSANGERLRTNLTCLWNGGPDDVCGTVITPVPEPATWALMISGFGLVGATLRRRRTYTV